MTNPFIQPFSKQANRAIINAIRKVETPWQVHRASLRPSRAGVPRLQNLIDLPTVPENMLQGRFAGLNKQLYQPPGKFTNVFTTPSGVKVEAAPVLTQSGRRVFPTRLTLQGKSKLPKNTYRWLQPFYESSGRATPGLSNKGTIWPFSGHHAVDDILDTFKHKTVDGWFGKYFFDLPKAAKKYKNIAKERLHRFNLDQDDLDLLDWDVSNSNTLRGLFTPHSKNIEALPPHLREVTEGLRNVFSIR